MAEPRAIDVALDLARMPALAQVLRRQALPPDVLDVIRVAAECPEASKLALATTQEPMRVLQSAAALYLEEMLFFPEATFHRNLGVSPGASKAQMRLHMRWLMRWLHPDHNPNAVAALLAARVINAWQVLGRAGGHETEVTNSTRHQHISLHRSTRKRGRHPAMRVRWIAVPIPSRATAWVRGQRPVAVLVAAALALLLVARTVPFGRLLFGGTEIPASQPGGGASRIDLTSK
jgi:hypothetical protein